MPATGKSQPADSLDELAELIALAVSDAPPRISTLCRTLGVSRRTLRNAFHKTYGIAPCRRLRMLRPQRVADLEALLVVKRDRPERIDQ